MAKKQASEREKISIDLPTLEIPLLQVESTSQESISEQIQESVTQAETLQTVARIEARTEAIQKSQVSQESTYQALEAKISSLQQSHDRMSVQLQSLQSQEKEEDISETAIVTAVPVVEPEPLPHTQEPPKRKGLLHRVFLGT